MKRFGLALLAVLIATVAFSSKSGPGDTIATWTASCIHVTSATRAEAPLVNGEPDWDHVIVHGLLLDKACFQYQVRH